MRERRTILQETPSIRVESKNGQEYFTGYAAVYNHRSRLIYERGELFYEVLDRGAFDKVLEDPLLDVILRIDHERGTTLARSKSKTLTLSSDERGLRFSAPVPNTTLGRDTLEMIKRGDYMDCSFEFTVTDQGEKWERDGDGSLIHIVREVSGLYDVTICTENGAYPDTVIDTDKVKRMAEDTPTDKDDDKKDDDKKDDDKAEKQETDDGTDDGEDDKKDPPTDDDISDKATQEQKIKTDHDLGEMEIDLLGDGATLSGETESTD